MPGDNEFDTYYDNSDYKMLSDDIGDISDPGDNLGCDVDVYCEPNMREILEERGPYEDNSARTYQDIKYEQYRDSKEHKEINDKEPRIPSFTVLSDRDNQDKKEYDTTDRANIGDRKLDNEGIWNKIKNVFRKIKEFVEDALQAPTLLAYRIALGNKAFNRLLEAQEAEEARQAMTEKDALINTVNRYAAEIDSLKSQLDGIVVTAIPEQPELPKEELPDQKIAQLRVDEEIRKLNEDIKRFNEEKAKREAEKLKEEKTPEYDKIWEGITKTAASITATVAVLDSFVFSGENADELNKKVAEAKIPAKECENYILQEEYKEKLAEIKQERNDIVNDAIKVKKDIIDNPDISDEEKDKAMAELDARNKENFVKLEALDNEYVNKGLDKAVIVGELNAFSAEVKNTFGKAGIKAEIEEAVETNDIAIEPGEKDIETEDPTADIDKNPNIVENEITFDANDYPDAPEGEYINDAFAEFDAVLGQTAEEKNEVEENKETFSLADLKGKKETSFSTLDEEPGKNDIEK